MTNGQPNLLIYRSMRACITSPAILVFTDARLINLLIGAGWHLHQINVQNLPRKPAGTWHMGPCFSFCRHILLDTHHTRLDPEPDVCIQSWIPEVLQGQSGCGLEPIVSSARYFMYHLKHLHLLVLWHQVTRSVFPKNVSALYFRILSAPMAKLRRTWE